MGIPGGIGAVVIDEHIIAPGISPAVIVVGLDDRAGLRRHNWGPVGARDVHTPVARIASVITGDIAHAGQGPNGIEAVHPAAPGGIVELAVADGAAGAAVPGAAVLLRRLLLAQGLFLRGFLRRDQLLNLCYLRSALFLVLGCLLYTSRCV